MEYVCSWEINITADSPEEAAQLADKYMRDQRFAASWLVVSENGDREMVDVEIND